jgi:hypothetical protein
VGARVGVTAESVAIDLATPVLFLAISVGVIALLMIPATSGTSGPAATTTRPRSRSPKSDPTVEVNVRCSLDVPSSTLFSSSIRPLLCVSLYVSVLDEVVMTLPRSEIRDASA